MLEPILLLQASRHAADFATVVLGIQVVGAILAFGFALRRGRPAAGDVDPPPPSARAREPPVTRAEAELSVRTPG